MRHSRRDESWLDRLAVETMQKNGFAVDADFDLPRGGAADESSEIRDLRGLHWSSIDNPSSRDLDQLEWTEQMPNGNIRLLIAVADVDAFVTKGGAIDRHAFHNTVSVYTQTEVFPMLPPELSHDRTSLIEGEDRLAVVAELLILPTGEVDESRFFRARVHNHSRLSYGEVGEWFDGGPVPDKAAENAELQRQLEVQREAARRLYRYREAKGALEFESVESSAVIRDGEVEKLVAVIPNAARHLIENFMIATNVEMAEFLELHGVPSIRRVVREPRNWEGIRRVARELGERLPSEPDQRALASFLTRRRSADPDRFADLSLSIVKLIGSGEYIVEKPGEDSGGHFGLAVRDYAHSTAPNRRYADLVVQRLVKAVIANEAVPYSVEELEAIAERLNEREKAARKVERKMRKIVAASVMRHRIGETFDAIVTGINSNGTFARILRPPVDGRIEENEAGLEVGQRISVRLLSADTQNGFIDFAALR